MDETTQPPSASDDEPPIAAGHTYDGIQEYENPTPLWWELLFVATVLFAPFYAIWFHSPGTGRTLGEAYQTSLSENMRLQFGEIGDLVADEATILTYMNEPDWLQVGASTFATNCVSCHGREGEGISGPNLTDDLYIHVKGVADIAKVVQEGANKGAMPAWANRLHPNEVVLVSAYVASLRGQDLPSKYGGVAGKPIDPWPAAPTPAVKEDKQASLPTTPLR